MGNHPESYFALHYSCSVLRVVGKKRLWMIQVCLSQPFDMLSLGLQASMLPWFTSSHYYTSVLTAPDAFLFPLQSYMLFKYLSELKLTNIVYILNVQHDIWYTYILQNDCHVRLVNPSTSLHNYNQIPHL